MGLLVSRRVLSLSVLSVLALPPSTSALSTTNPPALTGLAESDLAINLGRDPLNLEFSPGQQMRLVYSKVASGSYGENDVQVFYDRLDGKIVTVNAVVYGTDAVSGREFLAYLASLPIQGISPAAAKAWVYRNYPLVRQGRPFEKVFGQIRYELIGTNRGAMTLRVTNVAWPTWALKRMP